MSLEELKRLIKLYVYSPKEQRPELESLLLKGGTNVLGAALKFGQILLNWLFVALGWLTVLMSVVTMAQPPITTEVIPLVAIALILTVVLLPPTSRFMKKWAQGWLLLGLRMFFVLIGVSVFGATKPAVEQARRNSMPAAERYALELQDKERAAAKALEMEREAAEEAARRETAAREKRTAEETKKEEKYRKESDEEQRDFYDTLGAPKLLYRCGNEKPLKAVGATHGSINVLLRAAQSECGSSNFEIVKKKEN